MEEDKGFSKHHSTLTEITNIRYRIIAIRIAVYLLTYLHGVRKGLGSGREYHELLEGKTVACVRATIDDVEGRHRHDEVLVTS